MMNKHWLVFGVLVNKKLVSFIELLCKKIFFYHINVFFRTGTIEEKIYQRQVSKKALSKSIMVGQEEAEPTFKTNELKEIFNFRETISDTHE
jgi:hypothetical protein